MLGVDLSFEEDEQDLLVVFDEFQFYDCEVVTRNHLLCLEEPHLLCYLHVEGGHTGKKLAHRPYITAYAFVD
jgi:hypothetical protein